MNQNYVKQDRCQLIKFFYLIILSHMTTYYLSSQWVTISCGADSGDQLLNIISANTEHTRATKMTIWSTSYQTINIAVSAFSVVSWQMNIRWDWNCSIFIQYVIMSLDVKRLTSDWTSVLQSFQSLTLSKLEIPQKYNEGLSGFTIFW